MSKQWPAWLLVGIVALIIITSIVLVTANA